MITQQEFERLAKRMMDSQLRKFLREKGVEFTRKDQEIFTDRLQAFLFNELNAMGVWQQLMGNNNGQG